MKNSAVLCSSNPTSGYLPKANEIMISKSHLGPHVHCSITHNSHGMEGTKYTLTDEEMKKMWYVCMYVCIWMHIIQPWKKKEILSFVPTWMNLEGPLPGEISQPEKDKYVIPSV